MTSLKTKSEAAAVAAALDAQPEENVTPRKPMTREELRAASKKAQKEGKFEGEIAREDESEEPVAEKTKSPMAKIMKLVDELDEEERVQLLNHIAREGELASDEVHPSNLTSVEVAINGVMTKVSPRDFSQKKPIESFGEVVSYVFVHNETGVKFVTNAALAKKKGLPVYPF